MGGDDRGLNIEECMEHCNARTEGCAHYTHDPDRGLCIEYSVCPAGPTEDADCPGCLSGDADCQPCFQDVSKTSPCPTTSKS